MIFSEKKLLEKSSFSLPKKLLLTTFIKPPGFVFGSVLLCGRHAEARQPDLLKSDSAGGAVCGKPSATSWMCLTEGEPIHAAKVLGPVSGDAFLFAAQFYFHNMVSICRT